MDHREQAWAAFAARRWQDAYDGFRAASSVLDADDHDALAESAHWLGQVDEVIAHYTEAHRLHVEAGRPRRAALSAFMLAVSLRIGGESAQADGWLARAQRLLADADEGPEHGYPLYLQTAALMGSDLEAAIASARRMQELGRRFADDTLCALGVFFEGRALIKQARVAEGLVLLDEAMVAALSDELKPMWTGAIYCGLLDACHELADLRRAREWTEATQRWCSPLTPTSLYPGICRIHSAEMLQQRGEWEAAEAAALDACRDMARVDVFVVADGWYAVGEIRRRRGDHAGAEEAYGRAHEFGRDPQPGVALLRLAQGRASSALSSITVAIAASSGSPLERAPLEIARVDIALAAGDVALADQAAKVVADTAARFGSPGLLAAAAQCTGAVALARGESVTALAALRLACQRWQELDAPYECARTRVLLSEAYRVVGDEDAAARERSAAAATFERLGAAAELRGLTGTPVPACGLTAREIEILELVAVGKSNREIADTLVLSQKTVARHLSNIFTKLDVPSRSAATAFAFANGLVTAPKG